MAEEETVTEETTESTAAETTSGEETSTAADETVIGDAGASGDAATGEETTGGDTGGESAGDEAGASEVPETYADFELPEGIEITEETMTAMTSQFKELGLTQDQAQRLINFQADRVKASEEARADAFTQLTKDWLDQSKKDPEIGGEKFDETVATARGALKEFGTDGLNELLRDYGIGNHPEVIRAFAKVGALLKEDRPGAGTATSETRDRAELLYGTTD